MNIQRVVRFLSIGCVLLLLPVAAWAQASSGAIGGIVRDASGGVLPGVTVEASSPALIERVRTAVTDSQGLYQIVDLRPGVYTVSFTLPGFSTLRREGVDLGAGFTATVNAELRVGGIEETITVTGEAPGRRHSQRPRTEHAAARHPRGAADHASHRPAHDHHPGRHHG